MRLNIIFYFLNRVEKISEEEETKSEAIIRCWAAKWRTFFELRYVSPSFHLIEAHALEQFKSYSTNQFSTEAIGNITTPAKSWTVFLDIWEDKQV